MSNTFLLNRGSDLSVALNWPDGAGGNANLTGCTVALFEPGQALVGRMTVAISNAATGEITLALPWTDALASVSRSSFRVRVSWPGGLDQTTNELWLQFQ